jgi:two-component system chemotaxis response regulator CheB
MKPVRVIVVDDSKLIRNMFADILNSDPGIEVVATAEDPYDAREKIKKFSPDVITLDIEMPHMNGIEFLEKIMKLRPMPVVMVSTLTQKGARETIKALELGAIDYIPKPSNTDANLLKALKDELITKVKTAATARVRRGPAPVVKQIPQSEYKGASNKIVFIGSSTGGVEALREVITALPANCPPILIVQHMPPGFTASFAHRLNGLSAPNVQEARNGIKVEAGNVYIAAGDRHLEIQGSPGAYSLKVKDGEKVSGHKPSVDVLFRSAAEKVGKNAVGVILTGMGKDGAEGLLSLKRTGAPTMGQNEMTCTVYGMPKAAKELGAVDREFPISKIAVEILDKAN